MAQSAKKKQAPTQSRWQRAITYTKAFGRRHWRGTAVILVATLVFFLPIIIRINNYSEGGDAMFNAWTLARDQHCLLRQSCPQYSNANIYFPHKDTMLYSETQLSAGLLTLPLYLVSKNPILYYNVWTIVSFFLSGWFVYLLVKRLSKGHEMIAIITGLIFEFAPFKMAAVSHLQNLSIFYLPLAILLIIKYLEVPKRRYLVGLLATLTLLFYASWYQMVFALIGLGVILLGLLVARLIKFKQLLIIGAVITFAVILTGPLIKSYVQFSKSNKATFSIKDQTLYSSSLEDYVKPYSGTVLGKVYYKVRPHAELNAYNLDSYSYHGLTLYASGAFVVVMAVLYRRKTKADNLKFRYAMIFTALGVVGFLLSLGPLLKLKGAYSYGGLSEGLGLAIPMPYLLVDKLLPQLSFIRAIGRASVLFLLALCMLLAYLPYYATKVGLYVRHKRLISILFVVLLFIELAPIHMVPMSKHSYNYNLNIPKVYSYVAQQKDVNDLVILAADPDYPNAGIPVDRAEEVLWSGYTNKNIFNGYSGYTPPEYFGQYADFVDFHPDDIPKMQALGIRYILVDKQLSTANPDLANQVAAATQAKVYEDSRYALFKI